MQFNPKTMKANFLKFYITILTLLVSFASFAQDDPFDPPADEDPVGAPINSQLIWLAVVGVAFALFFFRNRKLQTTK